MTGVAPGKPRARVGPNLVSPIVGWLCHDDCPVTGEIYSAAGGRIARMFIGLTHGYYNPQLTVEDVRDHWDEIRDEEGYITPASLGDELRQVLEHFKS